MIARVRIDGNLSVLHLCDLDRACRFNLTDLAAAAKLEVRLRHPLPDDAEVVEIGLDAVVGTSAHRDLKLVGQFHMGVAVVEAFVDFLREGEGVDQSVLAGGALAGNDRADL